MWSLLFITTLQFTTIRIEITIWDKISCQPNASDIQQLPAAFKFLPVILSAMTSDQSHLFCAVVVRP